MGGRPDPKTKKLGSQPEVLRGVVALSLTALLIQACASGDVAAVVNLVTERHASASEQDEESGLTPLVAACEAGHMEVVKYISDREGGCGPRAGGKRWYHSTPCSS